MKALFLVKHFPDNLCIMKMSSGCVPGRMVTCLPHQFQCGSQECLDPVLVCNGITNCADGSDEGGDCHITCTEAGEGRCSHSCHSTPQGAVSILFPKPLCAWPDSFLVKDPLTLASYVALSLWSRLWTHGWWSNLRWCWWVWNPEPRCVQPPVHQHPWLLPVSVSSRLHNWGWWTAVHSPRYSPQNSIENIGIKVACTCKIFYFLDILLNFHDYGSCLHTAS